MVPNEETWRCSAISFPSYSMPGSYLQFIHDSNNPTELMLWINTILFTFLIALPILCCCAKGGTSQCFALTFAPYNLSGNYLLITDDTNYQAQSMLLIYIYILFNVGISIYLFRCQMKKHGAALL